MEFDNFINDDKVLIETYFVEGNSSDSLRMHLFQSESVDSNVILKRPLDVALVRGIERAVSVFGRYGRSEGVQCYFQDVSVVEGITLKNEVEVFEGVRLVPLLNSGMSAEVIRYFPGFPVYAFVSETSNFFRQTLLAIDIHGFSIFGKPSLKQKLPCTLPAHNLSFPTTEQGLMFRNLGEVDSFHESFSHALSLILNFPVQIPCGGSCLNEPQTFNPRHGSIGSLSLAPRLRASTTADENHIEEAKCLYKKLASLGSSDRDRL